MKAQKRRWDGIIFDFDGTLVDTAPDIASSVNAVFSAAGFRRRSVTEVEQAIGSGVRELMRRLLRSESREEEVFRSAVTAFRRHYAAHLVVQSRPYPGVREQLGGRLKPFRKAVVTNKPHDMTVEILERLGLSEFFDGVIGTGGGFPPKPDPSAVRHILARWGVGPGRAILIGDSAVDLETAREAGTAFAWVTYGYEHLSRNYTARGAALVFRSASEWKEMANGTLRR